MEIPKFAFGAVFFGALLIIVVGIGIVFATREEGPIKLPEADTSLAVFPDKIGGATESH